MKIIGINKETKEKVWFDTSWSWGNSYGHNLVCRWKEEKGLTLRSTGNRMNIDPSDYNWTVENIETENKINLCDNCDNNFANCKAKNIIFGTGIGNDNIIACEKYKPISNILKEEINYLNKIIEKLESNLCPSCAKY